VPSCILVGVLGLAVDIPLYTVIALIKSPYMLFKGWQRLLHDLISREGPFLETLCVPIAGLAILFWPLVVVGSVLLAVVSSIFVGLYGAVIVYQVAVLATVALPCHFLPKPLRVQPRKRLLSDVLKIVPWPLRRRSHSGGEFPTWSPWSRSSTSTRTTGFTFVKGQFFQSKCYNVFHCCGD
jgi:hypothetical protein